MRSNLDTLLMQDPQTFGGMAVFRGTRVPAKYLLQYLEAGDTLDDFLQSYPSVEREQALALLRQMESELDVLTGDEDTAG